MKYIKTIITIKVFLVLLLIIASYFYVKPSEMKYFVEMSRVEAEANKVKDTSTSEFTTLEKIKVEKSDNKSLKVTAFYKTKTISGMVETLASGMVDLRYAAVRKHIDIAMQGVTGFYVTSTKTSPFKDGENSGFVTDKFDAEKEFKIIVDKTFNSISIADLKGYEPSAWLNNVKVVSVENIDGINFEWSVLLTTLHLLVFSIIAGITTLTLIYFPNVILEIFIEALIAIFN